MRNKHISYFLAGLKLCWKPLLIAFGIMAAVFIAICGLIVLSVFLALKAPWTLWIFGILMFIWIIYDEGRNKIKGEKNEP